MREYSTLTGRFLHLSMSSVASETLEKAVDAFKEHLQTMAPNFDYSAEKKWSYSLKPADDGGPSIDKRTVNPEHVFWEQKNDKDHDPLWCLKIDSKNIVFIYRKNKSTDSGSWTDFTRLSEEMIAFWQKNLNVKEWKSLDITYFFAYGSHNIEDAQLIRKNWIEVKQLLQPFAIMPHVANFKSYLSDYTWDQSWLCALEGDLTYTVNTRLETGHRQVRTKDENSLEIHLFLTVTPPKEALSREIPWGKIYEVLHDNYQVLLTDYARASLMEDFK
jgi:hypothetical protein